MTYKEISVAQYLAHFLEQQSCPAAFQVSGGMIAFLSDAIERQSATPLVHNRHEQGSGFAAEGATRISGRPALAMATSGPGATNLITAIASCFFDSVPTVFITGQVRNDELKKDEKQRQNGFQELSITSVVHPLTKAVWMIKNASEIKAVLNTAWELCQSGRPGPVLIDIPIDVQQQMIRLDENEMKAITPSRIDLSNIAQDNLSEAISVLKCAKNPIVMIGGGVRTANATDRVKKFLQASKFPYVSTLMGLDAVDHNSERYLGFIGSYGNRWANEALSKADVLLVLGSRLDVRQTGTDIKAFLANKTIIRVDVDSSELSGRVKSSIAIHADLNCVIDQLLGSEIEAQDNLLSHEAAVSRRLYPQIREQEIDLELNPNYVMEQISVKFKDANGYVVDVGQHQMWAAQSLRIQNHQRFLTSGGLGSMGFAIPASIGASFYSTGRWVVIVGDGCLQLSIQELQTISHYKLPITIVILNNSQHGMVAQFQEENLEGRFTGTRDGFSNPNFKLISEAFGFQNYTRIHAKEDLDSFVTSPPLTSNGPELVEIIIDQRAKALPKMKFHS